MQARKRNAKICACRLSKRSKRLSQLNVSERLHRRLPELNCPARNPDVVDVQSAGLFGEAVEGQVERVGQEKEGY